MYLNGEMPNIVHITLFLATLAMLAGVPFEWMDGVVDTNIYMYQEWTGKIVLAVILKRDISNMKTQNSICYEQKDGGSGGSKT